MKYMIVFDASDRELIDEALASTVESLREDGDAVNNRLAARLESLEIAPVPEATPSAPDQATGDPDGLPLVAQLIHHGMSQTAAMQQRVIDSLQEEVDQLKAKEQLVTSAITALCSKPWVPHPGDIVNALYPEDGAVRRRARQLWARRGGDQ